MYFISTESFLFSDLSHCTNTLPVLKSSILTVLTDDSSSSYVKPKQGFHGLSLPLNPSFALNSQQYYQYQEEKS